MLTQIIIMTFYKDLCYSKTKKNKKNTNKLI